MKSPCYINFYAMKLSIITVNLNNKAGLEKTLRSLSTQTFGDFESIVIDGGSTDGSYELTEAYLRIIGYRISEKDSGIYNAMNKGIRAAKGEYLLFLNSGDYLTDDVLAKVFAEPFTEDIVYGNLIFTDGETTRIEKSKPYYTLFDFMQASLPHPATFIRKTLFDGCLYDETLRIVSDWEFFLKKIILEDRPARYLDVEVSYFDTHGISSSEKSQALIREERREVLRRYFNEHILRDYDNFRVFDTLRQEHSSLLSATDITPTFKRFLLRVDNLLIRLYKMLKRGNN